MSIDDQRSALVSALTRLGAPKQLISPIVLLVHPFDDSPIPPRKLEKRIRALSNEAAAHIGVGIMSGNYSGTASYIAKMYEAYIELALTYEAFTYAEHWSKHLSALYAATDDVTHVEGLTKSEAAAILGITPDATMSDIKRSYRDLAKLLHPDMQSDARKSAAESAFNRVHRAYNAFMKDDFKPENRSTDQSGSQANWVIKVGQGPAPRELRTYMTSGNRTQSRASWYDSIVDSVGPARARIAVEKIAAARMYHITALAAASWVLSVLAPPIALALVGVTAWRAYVYGYTFGDMARKRRAWWGVTLFLILFSTFVSTSILAGL